MNTTYKTSVTSPYQVMRNEALDVRRDEHPVHKEIIKNTGVINLTATIEEDTQTLDMLKHIPGVVSFLCTIRKDGVIISQGKGTTTIGRLNKYIERTVLFAKNASIIDAIVRCTKMLDALYLDTKSYQGDTEEPNHISDKQKNFLLKLVRDNLSDVNEINRWKIKIDNFNQKEASEAIKSFIK